MLTKPFVSIILPCKDVDGYTRECIGYCKKLDYARFEIILLPDNDTEQISGVRIIATGPVPPGAKRNIGVKNSCIDNDACPRSDLLTNAVKYLENPEVSGVGRPAKLARKKVVGA
ncbi:MAG: glycosyltransferase family 2 protein [Candidatus Bathyarchaeia archaeon]|jgi:glycosyltransferase involved in cell wall biosynthesis